MITARQSRAASALLGWTQEMLGWYAPTEVVHPTGWNYTKRPNH